MDWVLITLISTSFIGLMVAIFGYFTRGITKYELVEFDDEYLVKQTVGVLNKEVSFLSINYMTDYQTWEITPHVVKYCLFKNFDEAIKLKETMEGFYKITKGKI